MFLLINGKLQKLSLGIQKALQAKDIYSIGLNKHFLRKAFIACILDFL